MEDLLSLVEENIVIWLPALERRQREFYEVFLIGEGEWRSMDVWSWYLASRRRWKGDLLNVNHLCT